MTRKEEIIPVKINNSKVIMRLIEEKNKGIKREEKLFEGNPTLFFRKLREKLK